MAIASAHCGTTGSVWVVAARNGAMSMPLLWKVALASSSDAVTAGSTTPSLATIDWQSFEPRNTSSFLASAGCLVVAVTASPRLLAVDWRPAGPVGSGATTVLTSFISKYDEALHTPSV